VVDVAFDQLSEENVGLIGQVLQEYMDSPTAQAEDLAEVFLDETNPGKNPEKENPLLRIIGPIMGGMMIFYAFYTGTASAESIIREEEERTMPRLFTTPTPQAIILAGKFLSVFLTVLVQITVLLIAGRLIFKIEWGEPLTLVVFVIGVVCAASSFGIFINSFLKSTKQGGIIFGGVLTLTGMVGMIRIFAMNSPAAETLGNSVSLLFPQGWAVRGLLGAMNAEPFADILLTTLVLLAWAVVFFLVGVWRFNRRYA
jgi:ABC-2 type transport system permease protein